MFVLPTGRPGRQGLVLLECSETLPPEHLEECVLAHLVSDSHKIVSIDKTLQHPHPLAQSLLV